MPNCRIIFSDTIEHHGIKGQRWGIRRWQNEDGSLTPEGIEHYGKTYKTGTNERIDIQTKTKYGQDVTLEEIQTSKFAKLLGKNFENVYKNQLNSPMWNIKVDGKNVGEIELFQESEDSINVVWLGVREEGRGKGIATAALDATIADVKSKGYKQMTLEVPGDSPDARHIYESRGFVANEKISDDDDIWGGLTKMTLKFDDSLEHHGILGQKWGVRRFQNEDGSYTAAGKERYSVDSKPKETSNLEEESSKKKFGLGNLSPDQKKAIKTGAIIVGSALLVGGGLYLASKALDSGGPHITSYKFGTPLKDSLNMYSDNPVKLKKGTVFQRMSSEAIEDYTKTGETYVSHLLKDNLKYKAELSDRAPYIHKLKAKTEISAPSERKAAEIFLSIKPESDQATYQDFMTNAFMNGYEGKHNAYKKEFVDAVKKSGFNALIDVNDSGWTKKPLILLNPSETTTYKGSRAINAFERVMSIALSQ